MDNFLSGFAAELTKIGGILGKLAAPSFDTASPIKSMGKGTTVKSQSYAQANSGTGKQNISGNKDNIAVSMSRKSQGPSVGSGGEKGVANYMKANRRPGQDRLAKGPSVSQGKQFKNMQAGGNSAVAAKPAAGKPVAAMGSVTGGLNLNSKMPSLPGAGKTKPAVAAKPAAVKPVAAGGPAGRLRNQGASLAPMKPYS
jgi:hypothetical protein